MVQALFDLTDFGDRVLNIVKAKYGFRRKQEAANFILEDAGQRFLEPELRPEYVQRARRVQREKTVSVSDFGTHYGLR